MEKCFSEPNLQSFQPYEQLLQNLNNVEYIPSFPSPTIMNNPFSSLGFDPYTNNINPSLSQYPMRNSHINNNNNYHSNSNNDNDKDNNNNSNSVNSNNDDNENKMYSTTKANIPFQYLQTLYQQERLLPPTNQLHGAMQVINHELDSRQLFNTQSVINNVLPLFNNNNSSNNNASQNNNNGSNNNNNNNNGNGNGNNNNNGSNQTKKTRFILLEQPQEEQRKSYQKENR